MKEFIPTTAEPKYPTALDLIEIDITYSCNLKCNNCNRSCSQAPTNTYMTIGQIQKFISQAKESKHKFRTIRILGGEPTLHPDLLEILALLLNFRDYYAPETIIELATNGYGTFVKKTIESLPKEVVVINTHKSRPDVESFEPFNLAPRDFTNFTEEDYLNACWITEECGIGLNMYGYYHCAVAAGIDRVLGFDMGLKQLPTAQEDFIEQKKLFCSYCGHFLSRKRVHTKERKKIYGAPMSKSWKSAYKIYEAKKPVLKRF